MNNTESSRLRTWFLVVLMAGALGQEARAQTDATASSAIIGFRRIQLGEGWHAMGPPLEPFAVIRGTAKGLQKNQIALDLGSEATPWQTDQWRGYEICLTTGLAAGHRYEVLGNDVSSLMLSGDPGADGVLPGDAVSILSTVEEYLGSQLLSGDITACDWVATYANNVLTRLHRTPNGQWLDDKGRPVRLTVACGSGFMLNVFPGNTRTLFLTGLWNGDQGGASVTPGYQMVSLPITGSPNTLDSAFGPASLSLGPKAGATAETSDRFGVLDETTGEFRNGWLDAAQGLWRWQDTGDKAGGLLLEPGRGYLYYHAGDGFNWRWR